MSLSSSPLGRLFNLSLEVRQPLVKLGPLAAVMAGMLSAGRPIENHWFLSLLLLWIIVDPLFGSAWYYGVEQGTWKALIQAGAGGEARAFPWLPYTQPGSPSSRMYHWLGQFFDWWKSSFQPEHGGAFLSFWLAGGLILLLAWQVSPRLTALALLALMTIIILGISSRTAGSAGSRMLIEFSIPWLLGGASAGQPAPIWLVWLILFSLMYYAALRSGSSGRRWRWQFLGAQVTTALLLAVWQQYLFAALAGLVVILEWRLLQRAGQTVGDENGVAASQPFAIALLFISSLGVSGLIK